jgi:hypothetical protein
VNGLGARIAVRVLGLAHAHNRRAIVHVVIDQDLGDLLDGLPFLMGPLEVLLHHVAVRRTRAVHAAERGDGRGDGAGQVGAPDADPDGPGRRRRHGMLQEYAHLVAKHLLFRLGRNAVLEQNKHGVRKGTTLLGQVAQIVTAQDRFLFGPVGNRGFPLYVWISLHVFGIDPKRFRFKALFWPIPLHHLPNTSLQNP